MNPDRHQPGTLRWKLTRLREVVRREGPASLWFRLLSAAGVYRRNAWFARPLDEPIEDVWAKVPMTLCELTPAEIDDYLAFRRGVERQHLTVRFDAGWTCHAARADDGRIASVSWTAEKRGYLHYFDWEFELDDDEVYVFDSFTHRDFRGQRIQAVIAAHILRQYRERGFAVAYTMIVPENQPNVASRTRSGFRRTGLAGRWKLGPWRRYFFKGSRR